jgi:CRP/FNR family transcriptional regulator, cyclic AMP receptor protein
MPFEDIAWRELVGYLASSLVLAAFCVREMLPLRVIAIGSNLAFMSYGYLAGLRPVLLLHLVLLPTNLVRLAQLLRGRRQGPAAPTLHRATTASTSPSLNRAE